MAKPYLDPKDSKVTVVSAPAGSGKTTLLLFHYLRHLQRTDIERIVAITFTRKAAAELTGRLADILQTVVFPERCTRKQIDEVAKYYGEALPSPERARKALASLQSAPVSTVDAFTLSLVQTDLLHAGLPLADGERALIDAPVSSSTDNVALYESAARTLIETMSEDVKTLLTETTVGEAIREIAFLARNPDAIDAPGTSEWLDALGDELRPLVQNSEDWRKFAEKPHAENYIAVGQEWLLDPQGRPPGLVIAALRKVPKELKEEVAGAVSASLQKLGLPADTTYALDLSEWRTQAVFERGDKLGQALRRLATATRDAALQLIAQAGTLSYDELLLAATTLCESPSTELAERYDVLMVDELQDTNPQQLEFYQAFAAMRGSGERRIQRFFVGDARQSIYRFRAADPHGWLKLLETAKAEGTYAELSTNYRSSRLLVDAQRDFVTRLIDRGETGVDGLEELDSPEHAKEGLIDGRAPVVVVDGAEEKDITPFVLAEFANRLKTRWKTAPNENAAVLVKSWDKGVAAVRELEAYGIDAQLTGDRALLQCRVANDLWIFLRALLDRSDDIAALGVLKHPSIGVTDSELLLLRNKNSVSQLFVELKSPSPLRSEVTTKLAPLETARGRLGREPTADVLEWLVSTLKWRPLINAGPDGKNGTGLAQLEVLLDVVRGWETDRVDPWEVAKNLNPESEGQDLPLVRLESSSNVVDVTTIHGVKGLEYDHVALVGMESCRSQIDASVLSSVARPKGVSLRGLRLDPLGALKPEGDPMRQLMGKLASRENRDEVWRLFYVGFTRAKKSVTFGIGKKPTTGNITDELRELFVGDTNDAWCEVIEADVEQLASLGNTQRRLPMGQARPFESTWASAEGWRISQPSTSEPGENKRALVAELRENSTLVAGEKAPKLPELPSLEKLKNKETTLGLVVHGWLEAWAFQGEPSVDQALEYLDRHWRNQETELAQWLVHLGLLLRDRLPGFKELLAHKLHFEWPLLAVDGDKLWNGRADLIVELPGKRVIVIDFKAGEKFASAEKGIPNDTAYAPQLEAYRVMLTKSGYEVVEVGLLYVRGVSWVRLKYGADQDVAA